METAISAMSTSSHEELQAILQKGNECTQLSKAEIETACKEFDKDGDSGDNKITFLDYILRF